MLLIAIMLAAFEVSGAEFPLPDGWRLPKGDEITAEWRDSDPSGAGFLSVMEDFDGDGRVDLARLLVSASTSAVGVHVTLGTPRKNHFLQAHLEQLAPFSLQAVGLARVTPGTYKTACGKGYWDCAPGEVTTVAVPMPAINLFKIESASVFYVWSPSSGDFRKYWISD